MKLEVREKSGDKPVQYLAIYEKGNSRVESLQVDPFLTKKEFRELRDSSRVALINFGYRANVRDAFHKAFAELDRLTSGA